MTVQIIGNPTNELIAKRVKEQFYMYELLEWQTGNTFDFDPRKLLREILK